MAQIGEGGADSGGLSFGDEEHSDNVKGVRHQRQAQEVGAVRMISLPTGRGRGVDTTPSAPQRLYA
jgi:hypothetical protein